MHRIFIRWALGLAMGLSLFGVAGLAQGASLTPAQVSAILSLVQSFGADQGTINNVSNALGGSPTVSTNQSCLNLSANLYAGITDATTGGQVSQLQSFLGVSPTGYFGLMTLQAVQTWQSNHGVVSSGSPDTTGYGFVGPQTRAAMGCGGETQSSPQPHALLSASPVSGSTPLAVTYTATGLSTDGQFAIDFGDGSESETLQNATPTALGCFNGQCATPFLGDVSHTYTAAGTYTAGLKDSSGNLLDVTTINVTDVSIPSTAAQVQSIDALLQSFGANSETINAVQNALNDQSITIPAPSVTSLQAQSIITLLRDWNLNQSIINNVSTILGL